MNIWDRQATDTDESFLWFQAYRDASPPRRLDRIRTSVPGKVAPPLQVLLSMSLAGSWQDRAAAWDTHLDQVRQREREATVGSAARARAEEDEATVVSEVLALASREIGKLLQTSLVSDAETLRPGEVIKMAELAIKLGRLQRGETTEHTEVSVKDLSQVPVDALRQARALLVPKA